MVIPTRNRPTLTQRAVRAALGQSIPTEVIVVDDGSTDGTAAAVRGAFGDRVQVIETPPRNASAARNRGLEAARGTYVTFLDSDDTQDPAFAEALSGALDATGLPVASCDWDWIAGAGLEDDSWARSGIDPRTVAWRNEPQPVRKQLNLWHFRRDVTGNVLYRVDFIRSLGGWDASFEKGQDWEMTIRAFGHTPALARVDTVLHHQYRHSPGQIRNAVSHHVMLRSFVPFLVRVSGWLTDQDALRRSGCSEAELRQALSWAWTRTAVLGYEVRADGLAAEAARWAVEMGRGALVLPAEAPPSIRAAAAAIPRLLPPEARLRALAKCWTVRLRSRQKAGTVWRSLRSRLGGAPRASQASPGT
jgi:GT2 family glycosyltransferase